MAKDEVTYSVEITPSAHFNAKIVIDGVKFPRIAGPTPLWDELRKWMFENKCLGRGGSGSGPSFFNANFTPEEGIKLERWFEEHGVQVQYIIDHDPVEGSWTFDREGKWVDDDPLNPMRVPPGYALLKLDESTQPGDIFWHPAWVKWMPLPGGPTTAKDLNMPVARKT